MTQSCTLTTEYSSTTQEDIVYMAKSPKTAPSQHSKPIPAIFTPTQEQMDTLARRLMPEIKKFFADEQIQKEFTEWQERQNASK